VLDSAVRDSTDEQPLGRRPVMAWRCLRHSLKSQRVAGRDCRAPGSIGTSGADGHSQRTGE
jgi:hypothetical protein